MTTPRPNASQINPPKAQPPELVPGSLRNRAMHRAFWILLVGIPALPPFLILLFLSNMVARLSRVIGWFGILFLRYAQPMEARIGRWFPCWIPKVPQE